MGGIVSTNYSAVTGASLAAGTSITDINLGNAARLLVDTGLAGGASPQSAAISPSTVPSPATQRTLTALAGGAKAGATQMGYGANTVTVVATAADSVLLPYAFPGAMCLVVNADAADSMQVFGRGTDTVNAVATATGVAQAAGKSALYIGVTGTGDGTDAGAWFRLLSA